MSYIKPGKLKVPSDNLRIEFKVVSMDGPAGSVCGGTWSFHKPGKPKVPSAESGFGWRIMDSPAMSACGETWSCHICKTRENQSSE